jgi:hypothetical protein
VATPHTLVACMTIHTTTPREGGGVGVDVTEWTQARAPSQQDYQASLWTQARAPLQHDYQASLFVPP